MTILLSILGIHIVNVFFLFFTVSRIAARCGVENAYNIRFLFFLLLHPLTNCLAIISIFVNGEEGLTVICKEKIEKE